ncbi:hypothetical protein MWU52_09785 [Jannaschia sp. S6380]|uniref:hypothetical protein n=1 Tax=Jannaschia sp. S6380 TaxID=2926408 RepID=UPI001FF68E83|nr:hypothetical protein [Jannaschia sp. S6380]MCK0167837.1 hypothetical protein [Jannaschia sp. S6380]
MNRALICAATLALAVLAAPASGIAREGLSIPRATMDSPGPEIVVTERGAVRPHLAWSHPRPLPADRLRPRLTDCLAPGDGHSDPVDLTAYDWPGPRDIDGHQVCLFAIFAALDGPEAAHDWVRAVIAPTARPDCPARWNLAVPSRHGTAFVHVWRGRLGTPLFVDVLDRAARWSEELRPPVHSLLRTTFDAEGRPLVVKYERFTLGQRYGLARCP